MTEPTLYRVIHDLEKKRLIKSIVTPTRKRVYFAIGTWTKPRMICQNCGYIEVIHSAPITISNFDLAQKSRHFYVIQSQDVQFYGHCVHCRNRQNKIPAS